MPLKALDGMVNIAYSIVWPRDIPRIHMLVACQALQAVQ